MSPAPPPPSVTNVEIDDTLAMRVEYAVAVGIIFFSAILVCITLIFTLSATVGMWLAQRGQANEENLWLLQHPNNHHHHHNAIQHPNICSAAA
jgi:hypothetical protein